MGSGLRRQLAFLLVLAAVFVGIVLVVIRTAPYAGLLVMGTALAAGAAGRLLLTERSAGMLANRTRGQDAAALGGLGVAIVLLTLSLRATHASLH